MPERGDAMPDNTRKPVLTYVGRRTAHAAVTVIIALPLWVFFRGGFAEVFSASFAGFLLLTALVLFALLLVADFIIDAFLGARPGRTR